MDLLLKNVRLVTATEQAEPQDLMIRAGRIAAIGQDLPAEKTEVWDLAGACVSAGQPAQGQRGRSTGAA